jgi:hypothetical protein
MMMGKEERKYLLYSLEVFEGRDDVYQVIYLIFVIPFAEGCRVRILWIVLVNIQVSREPGRRESRTIEISDEPIEWSAA